MRKFIPVAAALAIVALLAVTILTSESIFSFSNPGTGDSADRAPADQSQPQDFTGSGSEAFYFGPDFICLIYSDSNSIECFGSDANNVVSGVPAGTGFTQIDGGDTYACAHRQTDRFTYCWGSITRRPSTIQPTATSESTATPEATATALPPGVTPEPTATSEPQPVATPTLEPLTRTVCHIPRSGSATYPLTLTGTWVSACTLDSGTPYIWDEWRQQGTGSVTITASSTGDPNLILFEIDDSLPIEDDDWATLLASNDDIDTDGGNYDAQIVHNLEDGKHYWVSVSPYQNTSRASFTLTYTSTNSDLGWGASYDPGDYTAADYSQIQSALESANE